MSDMNAAGVPQQVHVPTVPTRDRRVAITKEEDSAEVLFPKNGSGTGWQPNESSLKADQHKAAESFKESRSSTLDDGLADGLVASIGAPDSGSASLESNDGISKDLIDELLLAADEAADEPEAPPSPAELTRAPSGGSETASTGRPSDAGPVAPGPADSSSAAGARKRRPPMCNTVPEALQKINDGSQKVRFGKTALLNLTNQLQKGFNLGIPRNEIYHNISVNLNKNAVVFNSGDEDQVTLIFDAKDGKLSIEVRNAKKQDRQMQPSIKRALAMQDVTANFSTKRHYGSNKPNESICTLTFEHTNEIHWANVTKQGIELYRS